MLAVAVGGMEPTYLSSSPFGQGEDGFPYVSGKKLEWRSEEFGGKLVPFALIYRVTALLPADDGGTTGEREFLQVVKLSEAGACVIGSVPGTTGATANVQARELADAKARSSTCPQ